MWLSLTTGSNIDYLATSTQRGEGDGRTKLVGSRWVMGDDRLTDLMTLTG